MIYLRMGGLFGDFIFVCVYFKWILTIRYIVDVNNDILLLTMVYISSYSHKWLYSSNDILLFLRPVGLRQSEWTAGVYKL